MSKRDLKRSLKKTGFFDWVWNFQRKRKTIKNKVLSLKPCNKNSIIGRSIIIHKNRDDLGLGHDAESKKTGNAGKRLACGVIGLAK